MNSDRQSALAWNRRRKAWALGGLCISVAWLLIRTAYDFLLMFLYLFQFDDPISRMIADSFFCIFPIPAWLGAALAVPFACWWIREHSMGRRLNPPAKAPAATAPAAQTPEEERDGLFDTPNRERLARRRKLFGRFGVFFAISCVLLSLLHLLANPLLLGVSSGGGVLAAVLVGITWLLTFACGAGMLAFFWWIFTERQRDRKVRKMLSEMGADIHDDGWRRR